MRESRTVKDVAQQDATHSVVERRLILHKFFLTALENPSSIQRRMRLPFFCDYRVYLKFVRHQCDALKNFVPHVLFIFGSVKALYPAALIGKRVMQMLQGLASMYRFKSTKSAQGPKARTLRAEIQVAGFIQKNEQRFALCVAHWVLGRFSPVN